MVDSRLEFEFARVATDYGEQARWMHEYVIEKLCEPQSAFKERQALLYYQLSPAGFGPDVSEKD